MSRSVAARSQVTEEPRVASAYLPLVGEVPPQVRPGKSVAGVDLCELLAAAIDATGQRKEAAEDMGISGPVLSKQLARVEGTSPQLARVGQLKRETLIEFAERILAACAAGDPRVARQAAVEEAARALGKLVALALGA